MPKVSVIVPVYNVEKYLPRCIESIQEQTLTDWELLLIDDGSTDNSGIICDGFAKEDSRIRVFHKPNGGVSSARNVGLDNARGEWLAFVDSDDEVDSDYLDIQGVPDDANLVIKSFQVVKENGIIKSSRIIEKEQILEGKSFLEYYIQRRKNALWDKLIRRAVVGKVRFLENVRVGEDFLFILSCVPNIHKCYISPRGCYRYFLREGSVMNKLDSMSRERLGIIFNNINKVVDLTSQMGNMKFGECIIWTSYMPYLSRFISLMTDEEKKTTRKIVKGISLSSLKYASVIQIYSSLLHLFDIRLKMLCK